MTLAVATPLLAALACAAAAGQPSPPAGLTPGPLEISPGAPADRPGAEEAPQVTIRWGDSEPLVLSQDEYEEDAPGAVLIPDRQFLMGPDRVLLLGWSAAGSGMGTIHALIVERQGRALAIVDSLAYTTDEPSSALMVRRRGAAFQVGLFRPAAGLQKEAEWAVGCRAGQLDIAGIRRLPYVRLGALPGADFLYTGPARPQPTGEVAWIKIETAGFRLP